MPEGLLSQLGSEVVEAYFSSILRGFNYACLLAECPATTNILGLVVLRNSSSTRNQIPLGLWKALAVSIAQRPRFVGQVIFESWSNRGRLEQGESCIEYVYVHPHEQGRGLGHKLLVEATKESERAGATRVRTKTANARLAKHYKNQFGARVLRRTQGFGLGTTNVQLVWSTTSTAIR